MTDGSGSYDDPVLLHASLEEVDLLSGSVDVVLARPCLHYVADLDQVLRRLAAALVPGGLLVLTVVHPLLTAPRTVDADAPRGAWQVDDYFDAGPRTRDWLGGQVVWHHRTVEQHVQALRSAGLTLTELSECAPDPALLAQEPDELRRRRRVPSLLLLAGRTAGRSPSTAGPSADDVGAPVHERAGHDPTGGAP